MPLFTSLNTAVIQQIINSNSDQAVGGMADHQVHIYDLRCRAQQGFVGSTPVQ